MTFSLTRRAIRSAGNNDVVVFFTDFVEILPLTPGEPHGYLVDPRLNPDCIFFPVSIAKAAVFASRIDFLLRDRLLLVGFADGQQVMFDPVEEDRSCLIFP
jgi:hypothetical protein